MSKTKKEKKPMKRSRKILLRIGIALLTVLLLYTIAWGLNYYKYYKWRRMTGYDEKRHDYVYVEDGYMYAAFTPDHFYQFTSNFSITYNPRNVHENDPVKFAAIIWPRLDGSYDVRMTAKFVEWDEQWREFDYFGYPLEVDENLNIDYDECVELTEEQKKSVYDNRQEYYHMLDKIRELWGILKDCEWGD